MSRQSGGTARLDKATKAFYAALPPYNVKADGQTVTDAAITTGTNQLASVSAAFTQAKDANKLVVVVGAGTPIAGTTSGSVSGSITSIPVNALAQAFPPGSVTLTDGTHTQQFVTTGALAGATSIPLIGPWMAEVGTALTTGAAITSIPTPPLNAAVPSGTITLSYVDGTGVTHTQTFSTTGAAIAATSIPVTSLTPNYAYPIGTQIFGNPTAVTANATYAAGSTARIIPALSTTIASVSAGVATLAANAGTTVSGGECFYATDDTVGAQACLTRAAQNSGAAVFPWGDIGLSAALTDGGGSPALTIQGQGVSEIFPAIGGNLNYPTIAPYLKGTVFVQCSPNTDVLQMSADGMAQNVRHFGLRHAGRFVNTGHGLTTVPSADSHVGNVNGLFENVRAFGHDGNHYGFIVRNAMLNRFTGVRAYGGGGMRLPVLLTVGNYTVEDYYSCTAIGGIAHGLFLDGGSTGGYQYCTFMRSQSWVFNSPPAGLSPPTSSQYCLLTTNPTTHLGVGFISVDCESNVGSKSYFPNGFSCYRTSDPTGSGGVANPTMTGNPVSKTGVQNLTGKLQLVTHEMTLTPAAAATASTTLSAGTAAGATSITVASATGFAVGQGIQIGRTGDTGGNFLDYAIIDSIAGTTLNLIAPGNWALGSAHASGASVEAGAAVVMAEISSTNTFPGQRYGRAASPIGATPSIQGIPSIVVPSGWWWRMTWANSQRTWSDYAGSFA